ncbi:MAG: hypothetical protein Q4E13_03745 [Clostridia bacterium]|nr:hypothetical protein [Clostridia bacterium]
MATNKPRYSITVDEDMFQKIEDFRFENRFQSRVEATVELIRLGLEVVARQKQATLDEQVPSPAEK